MILTIKTLHFNEGGFDITKKTYVLGDLKIISDLYYMKSKEELFIDVSSSTL